MNIEFEIIPFRAMVKGTFEKVDGSRIRCVDEAEAARKEQACCLSEYLFIASCLAKQVILWGVLSDIIIGLDNIEVMRVPVLYSIKHLYTSKDRKNCGEPIRIDVRAA